MNPIKIFTDGACKGNQYANAVGGYGAIVIQGDTRTELSQGYKNTSNNRMELRAAIAALKTLKSPSVVTLHTDSKYICDAFNEGWLKKWQSNGWRTANRKPVKNIPLWQELLSAAEPHGITWTWVKGHNGIEENEYVDRLASEAAESDLLLDDKGKTIVSIVSQ